MSFHQKWRVCCLVQENVKFDSNPQLISQLSTGKSLTTNQVLATFSVFTSLEFLRMKYRTKKVTSFLKVTKDAILLLQVFWRCTDIWDINDSKEKKQKFKIKQPFKENCKTIETRMRETVPSSWHLRWMIQEKQNVEVSNGVVVARITFDPQTSEGHLIGFYGAKSGPKLIGRERTG